jgi:outer membrane protein assembly factor BamB
MADRRLSGRGDMPARALTGATLGPARRFSVAVAAVLLIASATLSVGALSTGVAGAMTLGTVDYTKSGIDQTAIPAGQPFTLTANVAALTYPTDGANNVDTSKAFTWSTTPQAQGYILAVGTTANTANLVNSGILNPSSASYSTPPLPSGPKLWATLLIELNGTWTAGHSISFWAAPSGGAFTSPLNGQNGVDPTATFTWSTIAQAQSYIVVVGTTQYGTNLVNSGVLPATQTSYTGPVLPTGSTLYATLITKVNDAWNRSQVITFTARKAAASFTLPINGQPNVTTPGVFTWTTITRAQHYDLVVGTTVFGTDLVNSGLLPPNQSSYPVSGLPPGKVLYATLLTEINGTWTYQLVAFTSHSAGTPVETWTEFHASAAHAGLSTGPGPTSPTVDWTFNPADGYNTEGTSPVLGPDGTIYLLRAHGLVSGARLDAVAPSTHQILWSWIDSSESVQRSTPAVATNGVVYVISDAGLSHHLVAIAPGGATLWKTTGLNLQGTPTIGQDATVYVEDASSAAYAIDPTDGHVLWSFAGSQGTVGVRGFPALSPNGLTVYIPSGGGNLYAVSAGPTGGALLWTYHIPAQEGFIENSPAVGGDGTIYVAAGGTYGNTPSDITAVSAAGTALWTYTTNGTFETTPTVTSTGLVVAANDVGSVFAVNQSDGTLAWSYQAPGQYGGNGFYNSSAASTRDGTTYVQNQFSVFALSNTGTVIWTVDRQATYFGSSPALEVMGTLYVAFGQDLIAYKS